MIRDTFKHKCTIYRLQGFEGYDMSVSEEGEVTESWRIVVEDVACLFEPEDTPVHRRPGGMTDIGTHRLFIDKEADIRNGDRIYWSASETGEAFYEVKAAMPKRDMFMRLHHKEAILDHIDWAAPIITLDWLS